MAQPPTRASGPFRPTRLGQWEVIAKIAGGGMSAVYLGRRVEPASDVPNVVALKIVRYDVAKDERLLRMFLEEGKLIARLVHPNIVRTLEVGGDAEHDFIAMELMLGKTFAAIHDALVTRGVRLNAELAAWTAARVADALHYAHELTDERGKALALVHRDVNPANVFATFDGEVKLFDFGLAKVTAGERSGRQMLAGKLSYLSPEQIMQMPLDRRSDVFSLGTTLWELLTSKRLFRRDSDADTVRAVQLGPIPDPRTVAPELPDELARIAKTALERNRDHRYTSTEELARELDEFVLARTSPEDLRTRLAQLVDTLFPGEQKRQAGWLKPAINSPISRSMKAVSSPSGAVSLPPSMPAEGRRDSADTTSVPPSSMSASKASARPMPTTSQRPPPLPEPMRMPAGPSSAPPRPASMKPGSSSVAPNDQPRAKRAAVPLPSQSRIEAHPAKTERDEPIPEPSDSAPTDVYVPLPPDRKRP